MDKGRGGDAKALTVRAMKSCGDSVFRLAYSHCGNKADAEDIVQEVFTSFFQRVDESTLLWDEEHLKAWLLRVTINRCKNHHKSAWIQKREVLREDTKDSGITNAQFTGEVKGVSASIEEALESLSEKERSVIHLFYFEDFSVEKIAKVTGEREGTIRVRLHRARKTLKKILGGFNDWT